jgi:DNA-binding winged helix-turn-helix (wHTH) protein
VTKDALMREAWSSVAVEDNNLTVQITSLRKILDAGRTSSSCIHTVTGRGYRFVAAMTRLLDTAVGRSRHEPQTPLSSRRRIVELRRQQVKLKRTSVARSVDR